MKKYHVGDQAALIHLARREGWIVDDAHAAPTADELPVVTFHTQGRRGELPPIALSNNPSLQIRIPEAIVHGRNFSLVIGDQVFPGGFAHSFQPSPDWGLLPGSRAQFSLGEVVSLDALSPALVGLLSHWGHFFVDALDRLLRLQQLGMLDAPLLVGDADFFGMQPVVDECHAVPQVSQLLALLGIDLKQQNIFPIGKHNNYLVTDMKVFTLESTKPSISSGSMRILRQRLLGRSRIDGPQHDNLVFVGRRDIKKRFIVHQAEIVSFLESAHRAQVVFPEDLTAAQAIAAFGSASRIILPLGSAKFNLSFCRPGTRVVCITPKGYAQLNGGIVLMTRHLCQALDLKLVFYDVEIQKAVPLVNSNLIISQSDIENIIDIFDELA